MEGSSQVLALAKTFAEWRLPGYNTLLSLATILSFLLSQWSNIPALSSVWQPLTRRFTASVTLGAEDRLTKEVIDWVSAKILWPRKTRFWVAHSDRSEMEQKREERRFHGLSTRFQSVEQNDNILFEPENQTTWFIFRRRLFLVNQIKGYSSPEPYSWNRNEEAIQIICVGRSLDPIKEFLRTCRSFGKKHTESFVSIYTSANTRWLEQSLQPARPLDTIHLDHEVKQDLLADICDYIDPKTRRFYADRGIPYRRGYLLHGPPGTGKTSLCVAIAGIIKLPLYILRIASLQGDYELEHLFNSMPSSCLVLMEDIDAVQLERNAKKRNSRRGASDNDEPACTLSALLNVLDGVASLEGRVVIMTANEPQLLDRALVRPGRIDRKIYLGHMSQNSARSMFLRFMRESKDGSSEESSGDDGINIINKSMEGGGVEMSVTQSRIPSFRSILRKVVPLGSGDALEKLADEFSKAIPEDTFTPAQIQEYLLKQRANPREAAAQAAQWVVEEKARMEEEAKEEKRREEEEEKKKQKKKKGKKKEDGDDDDDDESSEGGDTEEETKGGEKETVVEGDKATDVSLSPA
jgi:chaperone BCS1